jgi:mannose-6-phosphate isomerase
MTNHTDAAAGVQPLLVEPHLDERIWGGDKLARRFGKPVPPDKPIGESWEIYDDNIVRNGPYAGSTIAQLRTIMGRDLTGHVPPERQFPILTKMIDAHDVLSVQVHPDDHFAQLLEHQPNGKTECWYVIEAEPDAVLTYGFVRDSNPQEYEDLVKRGELEGLLLSLPVGSGDVVYIPAGTVHAIGAGIVVYELQQTSDVTYRIYDWNRRDAKGQSRELHVDKARQVLDYHRWTRGKVEPLTRPGSGRAMLIAGEYFCEECIEADAGREISTYDSAVAVFALDQPLIVEAGGVAVSLAAYSSLLVPAAAGSYRLIDASDGETGRALVSYIPESQDAVRTDLEERGFSTAEIDTFMAQFAPADDLGKGIKV